MDLSISWIKKITNDHGYTSPLLPFLILEDAFEQTSISQVESIWNILEARKNDLTEPALLFPQKPDGRGVDQAPKLAIVRISNGLLRRLSSTHHTEICGRVLMFTAWACPLDERSGVNLGGNKLLYTLIYLLYIF